MINIIGIAILFSSNIRKSQIKSKNDGCYITPGIITMSHELAHIANSTLSYYQSPSEIEFHHLSNVFARIKRSVKANQFIFVYNPKYNKNIAFHFNDFHSIQRKK